MKREIHTITFNPESIQINDQSVLAFMGYREKTYPEQVIELINEILSHYHSYLKIISGWLICYHPDIDNSAGTINCEKHQFNCGKIIVNELKESEKLVLFLTTIGSGIQEWANTKMKQNDLLAAYIIDIVGSLSVELSADMLYHKIIEKSTYGKQKLTNRYSPGYCGWNVAEQHKLFSFFPKGFCGITLTDSALMLPFKSVSGIIGIGEFVKKRKYKCGVCSQENCIMRKKNILY